MLAVSLFGITDGFEVDTFGDIGLELVDEWIILNSTEFFLSPDEEVFMIFRKKIGQNILTWIGLYRHAIEIRGQRKGGFYGAGVWLWNNSGTGITIASLLPLIADQVESHAMRDKRFVSKIRDIRSKISWPDQLGQKLSKSMNNSGFLTLSDTPHRGIVDLSIEDNSNVETWINLLQQWNALSDYNRVFLCKNTALATTIANLGLYKSIQLNQVIANSNQKIVDKTRENSILRDNCKQLENANKILQEDKAKLLEGQSELRIIVEGNKTIFNRLALELEEIKKKNAELQSGILNLQNENKSQKNTIQIYRDKIEKLQITIQNNAAIKSENGLPEEISCSNENVSYPNQDSFKVR